MSLGDAARGGAMNAPGAEGRARVRIWGVVLLSLLIPGLGHLHAGHGRAGILVWVVMTGLGLGATLAFHLIWPGAVALGLVVGFFLLAMVAVAVDAASRAVRDRRRGAVRPSPRLW